MKTLEVQAGIASELFSLVYSALDVFTNEGYLEAQEKWTEVLNEGNFENGDFQIMNADIEYSPNASDIHDKIISLK